MEHCFNCQFRCELLVLTVICVHQLCSSAVHGGGEPCLLIQAKPLSLKWRAEAILGWGGQCPRAHQQSCAPTSGDVMWPPHPSCKWYMAASQSGFAAAALVRLLWEGAKCAFLVLA